MLRSELFLEKIAPLIAVLSFVIVGTTNLILLLGNPIQVFVAEAAVSCGGGHVAGTIYRDFNDDGTQDLAEPGFVGITVTVFAATGIVTECATDTNGDFSFTVDPTDYPLRLELNSLPSYMQPGAQGTDTETTLTFVTTDTTGVDIGVHDPTQYCQSNPRIAIACYENGTGVTNTNAALVSFHYNATGEPAAYGGAAEDPRQDAQIANLGTVWGGGFNSEKGHLYLASFLKRHVAFAESPAHVYLMDYSNDLAASQVLSFSLQNVAPANGGVNIDLGSVCRQSESDGDPNPACDPLGELASEYVLPDALPDTSRDLDAFDKVGKISFGDIDLGPDFDTLWLINLNQQALISVDVSGLPTTAVSDVNQYPLTTLPGAPTCNLGEYRPWAIKFNDGMGYIGAVCSAENGGAPSDLVAHVHQFDPADPALGLTAVVSFTLDFNREPAFRTASIGDAWNPWQSAWGTPDVGGSLVAQPQPILANIEFTDHGDMVLGFMDRWGHQAGHDNHPAISGDASLIQPIAAGDIIHVCRVGNSWVVDDCGVTEASIGDLSEVNDGPSGSGEFYHEDFFKATAGGAQVAHYEITSGGLFLLPGQDEVISVVYDPLNEGSITEYRTQGVHWYSTDTGQRTNEYKIVDQTNDAQTFGKANGLGEPVLICSAAPIEIGNRVWIDDNRDGVQDPAEDPVPNVVMGLYDLTHTLIATTTTDALGTYYFRSSTVPSLTFNMTYTVGVLDHNFDSGNPLDGYTITPADTNPGSLTASDIRDSDGLDMSAAPVGTAVNQSSWGVVIVTGRAGHNNHTYDFGVNLVPVPVELTSFTAQNQGGDVLLQWQTEAEINNF
ncbi:MAG: SdrD B-like domain-containing protein, partial [Chloroflexota bacterium]